LQQKSLPNIQSRSTRKRGLLFIEGQKPLGTDFAGDSDMKEIHRADGQAAGMLRTEFVRGACGVCPLEFHMWPIAEADLVFE